MQRASRRVTESRVLEAAASAGRALEALPIYHVLAPEAAQSREISGG